ncbi:MAG: LCP family protein [Propionibacterium sp.]|nr:LCP family protein [Propionibacterium sp.]
MSPDDGSPRRPRRAADADQPGWEPRAPSPPEFIERTHIVPSRAANEAHASTPGPGVSHPTPGSRQATDSRHPFTQSLVWTMIGTIVPGLGFWPTRLRRLGLGIIGIAVVAILFVASTARTNLGSLAAIAVEPTWLTRISVGAAVIGVLWVVTIVGTHLLTRPRMLSRAQRVVGSLAVAALSFLVSAPLAVGSSYALDQRDLITSVFKSSKDSRSQTRPTDVNTAGSNPWANKPRVNILLLGGDNSAQRDAIDPTEGIRTDTMMLASIDTSTGNTVIIQVPRNMYDMPFPQGSALGKAYPNGFTNGDPTGASGEFMANAVWKNVPANHPELFKNTDYPGADALKMGITASTGLSVDYFLLVNIDGIQALINAMGGVTVNINERIPMGGNSENQNPLGWLEPGPDQHLNGMQAMWYARSRWADPNADFGRMARQSCLVDAAIKQANPQTMLTRYESIATASKKMVITDIPQELLPALADLALTVKGGTVSRLLFQNGVNGFISAHPDYTLVRRQVSAAIAKSKQAPTGSTATTTATATSGATSSTSATRTTTTKATSAGTSAGFNSDNLVDACAYHPQP